MAFIQCGFHSDALGKACSMNVLIPQRAVTQIGLENNAEGRKDYPVVYLLHGLSDDHSIWMRRTSIERYAAAYQAVIVMPTVDRGFYTDMASGYNYWSFISEELPAIVADLFPVSTKREDTFAAGLSMGGYGALKLALRRPDRFAAAVSLSAVADIHRWYSFHMAGSPEAKWVFGEEEDIDKNGNNLLLLADSAVKSPAPPRIMQICGTEDFLYEDNQTLRKHLQNLNFPEYKYCEGPGVHCWEFWDQWIQTGLDFLLKGK